MRPPDLGVDSGRFAARGDRKSRPIFFWCSEQGDLAEDGAVLSCWSRKLRHFYPPEKRGRVKRLTVCGGLMLADALDALVLGAGRSRQ